MPTFADMVYHLGGVPVSSEFPLCVGNVYFVGSSGGSDAYDGKTKDKPFATIDKALTYCTLNDMIILLPGHAETVNSTAVFNIDKAGVTLWGMGNYTRRPTFTVTTGSTATCAAVTAANVRLHNLRFVAGLKTVTRGVFVDASGVVIDNCRFDDVAASSFNFDYCIETGSTAHSADGLVIQNSTFFCGSSLAEGVINLGAANDNWKINGNSMFCNPSTGTLAPINSGSTLACANFTIMGNCIVNAFTTTTNPGIRVRSEPAGTQGVIAYNLIAQGSTDVATFKTNSVLVSSSALAGAIGIFENYVCGKVAMSGILSPAVVTS